MPGRASQLAQTSNEKVFLVAIHFLQVFALACEAVVQQRDKDPESLNPPDPDVLGTNFTKRKDNCLRTMCVVGLT